MGVGSCSHRAVAFTQPQPKFLVPGSRPAVANPGPARVSTTQYDINRGRDICAGAMRGGPFPRMRAPQLARIIRACAVARKYGGAPHAHPSTPHHTLPIYGQLRRFWSAVRRAAPTCWWPNMVHLRRQADASRGHSSPPQKRAGSAETCRPSSGEHTAGVAERL